MNFLYDHDRYKNYLSFDPVTLGLLGGAVLGGAKSANDSATAGAAKAENTVSNKWAPLLALNHSKGAGLRPMPNQNPVGNILTGLLGGASFGQANPELLGGETNNIGQDTIQIGPYANRYGAGTLRNGGFARGGMIPGAPKVPGDSFKNDVKPIWASAGEAIVPRSVMKNPKQKVAAYLNAVKKHGPGPLPAKGAPRAPKMSPWAAMACGGVVK